MKNSVRLATVVTISLILMTSLFVVLDTNLLGNNGGAAKSTTTSAGGTTTSAGGTTTSSSASGAPSTQLAVITEVQSGLVASDALGASQTQQQLQSNQSYWLYGGSADVNNSYYGISVTTNQLQIGVASPVAGQWVGYYAASPPTDATLVNAMLTAPSASLAGHYSVGLYVQATDQLLNYVACIAATTPQGTTWEVVHDQATNSTNGSIVPLWGVSNFNQKLSQDCTILTNGTNYLKVYLNHVAVYQSSTLQLGMQAPFNFYLESESSSTGALIYGGYQNFYATQGGNVTITNAPANALSAAVVDSAGTVLGTAPVVAGTANVAVGQYSFPQVANVELYSSATQFSNSTLVASTRGPVSIYGGDVFTFGLNPNPSSSSILRIDAVDANGNSLNGISAVLTQNRNAIASGYMPVSFSLNNTQSYSVTASDFGIYTFDHWSDGSTLRTRTLSVTSDTQLTAVYRVTDASAPSGTSLLSVSAVDSNGNPLTGFSVSVWQDGTLVATSFSPSTFLLKDGVQYQVAVSSFGNYKFVEWNNGITSPLVTVVGSITSPLFVVTGSSTTPSIDMVAGYSNQG